jgi:hypothetical protein
MQDSAVPLFNKTALKPRIAERLLMRINVVVLSRFTPRQQK